MSNSPLQASSSPSSLTSSADAVAATATITLSLLKIFSGCFLALSAFLGSLVPELLMRMFSRHEFQTVILPVGNALSAGLLFSAGMIHFFSEGTSALASILLSAQLHKAHVEEQHGATAAAAAALSSFSFEQQHKASHESLIHAATRSGFATAAPAMMLGYLLSLVIDRVALEKLKRSRKLPDWMDGGGHGHSHGGGGGGSSHNHHHHDHSSDTPEDDEDEQHKAKGHSLPTASAANSELVVIAASPLSVLPGSPASSSEAKRQQQQSTVALANAASVLTIAVLMSLHSAIEGTTLALETSAKTLRGAFIPLFVHRFFDGVVVGFQASAVTASSSSSPASSGEGQRDGAASSCSFLSTLSRVVFRRTTLVLLGWSIITPVVLILVLLTSSGSGNENSAAQQHQHGHHHHEQSFAGAWAQCFAAGSFVYISGELLNECFSRGVGESTSASASVASQQDWLTRIFGPLGSRVFGLSAGVAIVLLLEVMDAD